MNEIKYLQQIESIAVPVPQEYNDIETMRTELKQYTDVLLYRTPMPISVGINTLYEVAVAYYGRAKEIEMGIKEMENKNHIQKKFPFI